MLQNFGLCMGLLALGLGLRQIADSFPMLFGLSKEGWSILSIAQLLMGVVFAVAGYNQYRCPECNEIVKGDDKHFLGVSVDPEKCPTCGSKLR